MKYKVGDKVRIRKDLKITPSTSTYHGCVSAMLDYAGNEVTIASINSRGYTMERFPWNWSDYMLEDIWKPKMGEKVLCQSYDYTQTYNKYIVADIGKCYVVSDDHPDCLNGAAWEIGITTWAKSLVSPIPKEIELTMQEIADKFGVDVNDLKIKK